MHYLIYKTTNLVNGKIYIGKHQTDVVEDGYLGSGKWFLRAVNKYGSESFTREILFDFDNEEDMNLKEAELVTEEFCSNRNTYNIMPGGQGGWTYVNQNGGFNKDHHAMGVKAAATRKARGYTPSEETRRKIAESNRNNKERGKIISKALTGRTFSDDHKKNISEALKIAGVKPPGVKGLKFPNRKKRDSVSFKEVECPHCHKVGKENGMKRWHFDKCRHIGLVVKQDITKLS